MRRIACSILALLGLVACDGPGNTPPPADGGRPDAGPPMTIDDLPVAEELALPGLDGPVEVVYDDRGVPHIYGTTRHDVLMVEGYVMSRDRFGQMEFIRRNVIGRLAEVAGALSPTLVNTDAENLLAGYRRVGEEVYASLPPTDETRLAADAFVEGINLYIDRINLGEDPVVRGAEVLNPLLANDIGHWRGEDVFAMARFQAANLSFDADPEVRRSRDLARVLAAFPEGDADPRLAARSGLFSDLYGEWPARAVFSRDGFNDGTTMAFQPPGLGIGDRPRRRGEVYAPQLASLEGALAFLERRGAMMEWLAGDEVTRGSNNWAIGASLSHSGNPILANDPHLSLISPSVWWYVHLNTARMGGEDMIDAQGVAFAGLPGVVLGFNRNIAWGATTTGYDVTDVYEEQVTGTCTDGDVISGTVEFEGAQVAITYFDEVIPVAAMMPQMRRFPVVPHHGYIIPGSCAPVLDAMGAPIPDRHTAISVRYTGDDPSNELAYFVGLLTAANVAEAIAAQDAFRVGSQNFVVVDRSSISWSTESRIPVRPMASRTYSIPPRGMPGAGIPTGYCPHLVLPGTGGHEWMGDLDSRFVPHDVDPARGWVATANQDNVGVTMDGNPCNDPHYLGANFDYGWREARIQERLTALASAGHITPEQMVALQAENQSSLGDTLRDPIVAILEDPAAAVPTLSATEISRLADARTRLMAWTLRTPHGVGATDATEIADSIGTTIFNAMITRIIPAAFEDEMCHLAGNTMADCRTGGPTSQSARLLEWMMTEPNRLFTYDETLGDSVLWDDLRTAEVETQAQIVVRGALAGLDYLVATLGADASMWRWGRLHTVTFESVLPALPGAMDQLSIPPEGDTTYPNGFPRHGDWGNVDPGNYGLWNTTNWSFGSGASQRLVVEMTPEGPLAWNAIPGGQSIDPDSPHKSDEALLWIRNEQPPLYFRESDVVAHWERRVSVR